MNDTHLFAFESDFVATLRCVPMAVRFKLDGCGVKLTLREWSRLTAAYRHELLLAACHTAEETAAYRARLLVMVAERTRGVPRNLPAPPDALWEQSAETPETVRSFARTVPVDAPTDVEWAGLSQLQRFALIKLARDNHDNVNFVPALKEFGLLPEDA